MFSKTYTKGRIANELQEKGKSEIQGRISGFCSLHKNDFIHDVATELFAEKLQYFAFAAIELLLKGG